MAQPTCVNDEDLDVLVVGGGPAGLAAAARVAGAGLTVGLVDERVTLGGQIFKRMGPGFEIHDPRAMGPDHLRGDKLIDAVEATGVRIMLSTSVVALEGAAADEGIAVVLVPDDGSARTVRALRLVLAPGAHDRPVVFPGWTLPGVLTAGGAQALVKTQRVLPGEAIAFAGSGPLALAFPAQLHGYGANVELVLEAGPAPSAGDVLRMLAAARGNLTLLRDAIRYRLSLLRARVPLRYGRIIVRAEGDGRLESITHAAVDQCWRILAGSEETVAADTLCLGYGFVPSTELPRMAGCAFGYDEDRGGAVPIVDEWMCTSVPGVSAAGDGVGVDGSYVAVHEGTLAGIGAALHLGALSPAAAAEAAARARAALKRKRTFGRALRRMHRIGEGVFELADAGTVVCRCEEVRRRQLDDAIATSPDPNVVKALTRAGMGLCQGRNCHRHVAALIAAGHRLEIGDVEPATPRSPARPVALGAIARTPEREPGFFH